VLPLHTYTIRYLNRYSTEYLGGTIQLSSMAARLRLLSSAVKARLLSSITVIPRLLSSEVNARLTWLMCYLLIYMRPLLLNEPFVVTVETSVRITIELLLLAMQRSIVAFPWKCLFWIPKTCNNTIGVEPSCSASRQIITSFTGHTGSTNLSLISTALLGR
jgi:hypothetical protein